jgi:RHS repeat-associated protein
MEWTNVSLNLSSRKFATYERDWATNLDYAQARMYHHNRARFMQPDPKGHKSARLELPQSLNRYAYVNNNSINSIDPEGLDWFDLRFFAESECRSLGYSYVVISIGIDGFLDFLCGGAREGFSRAALIALGELWDRDAQDCPVEPLTPLDQNLQRYEDGYVDIENLVPALQQALACLQRAARDAGGVVNPTSGYRPEAYNAHLQEVWDKWQLLRNNRQRACRQIRLDVQREFNSHGMIVRPALRSNHTIGQAFDANWDLPAGVNIDSLAAGCGLHRPVAGDRVHFTLTSVRG